jgi:hypothetical protein
VQLEHRQRAAFAQQLQVLRACLVVVVGQFRQVAKPGVLVFAFRRLHLAERVTLPDFVMVNGVRPVVERFAVTVVADAYDVRIGAGVEQQAQHFGVHVQGGGEQGAGAVLAGTIRISAKPQHFLDDRVLRRLRVEIERADRIFEDRIAELIPAIQVESIGHQITQGFDVSGTRMRHEALDPAFDVSGLSLMMVHRNSLVIKNSRGREGPSMKHLSQTPWPGR